VSNQDNRDREGNLGQTGRDSDSPAGTSGRQGNTGTENWQQGNTDANRPPPARPSRHDDEDEDSGLGNRTTNR
jgi:hypothetical protein